MASTSSRKLTRLVALVVATAGLVAIGQPAYALSNTPDPTWGANGRVYALARSGNVMFVGGSFKKAISPSGQKVVAANLMAVDMTTGLYVSTFTPSVVNTQTTAKPEIDALAVSADGSTLFIGGVFDTVNGVPRQNFAAVDTATGTQVSSIFTAEPNSKVNAILVGPDKVYLGGNFTKVSGVDRLHLAALSGSDGSLSTVWAPSATAGTDPCPSQFPPGTNCGPTSNGGTGNIHSLAFSPDGASIFVGGNFYYINGTPRNALARVSAVDGSLINWRVPWATIPSESNSNPYRGPNVVWAILPTASRVYIAWGRTPNGFSAFNMNTTTSPFGECSNLPMGNGCATRIWSQGTPGNAESLALSPDGTRLFVGGHFGTAVLDYKISSCGSNVYAHGLVSVNPTNGAYYCDWIPQAVPFGGQSAPGSGVNPPNYVGSWAMVMTSDALFVGGYFTAFSGVPQFGMARFTLVGSPPPLPPVPTITSFTPTSGPVGTTVTITGTGFTGATEVRVGSVPATSFTVNSDTQITFTVPNGATTAILFVTTPGGTAKSTGSNFKVTPASIDSIAPTSGPVGAQVVLTGVGFTGAQHVWFNGVEAAFSVDSNTRITTTVPAGATTGFVTVETASGGTLQGPTFTVSEPPPPAPTITTFTPTTGPVGSAVTITGTNFTGANDVSFGTIPATSYTVDSDTQITAIVPPGFDRSIIFVTTPGGTAKSVGMNFRVPPSISSFTPTTGPVGTSVTITGSVLAGTTAVKFGSIAATSFTVDSDTQVTAIVPAGFDQAAIKITTGGGTVTSSVNFVVT